MNRHIFLRHGARVLLGGALLLSAASIKALDAPKEIKPNWNRVWSFMKEAYFPPLAPVKGFMLMTLSGFIVTDERAKIKVYTPDLDIGQRVNALVRGEIPVEVWACEDTKEDQCLRPQPKTVTLHPEDAYLPQVLRLLPELRKHLVEGVPLKGAPSEIADWIHYLKWGLMIYDGHLEDVNWDLFLHKDNAEQIAQLGVLGLIGGWKGQSVLVISGLSPNEINAISGSQKLIEIKSLQDAFRPLLKILKVKYLRRPQ